MLISQLTITFESSQYTLQANNFSSNSKATEGVRCDHLKVILQGVSLHLIYLPKGLKSRIPRSFLRARRGFPTRKWKPPSCLFALSDIRRMCGMFWEPQHFWSRTNKRSKPFQRKLRHIPRVLANMKSGCPDILTIWGRFIFFVQELLEGKRDLSSSKAFEPYLFLGPSLETSLSNFR